MHIPLVVSALMSVLPALPPFSDRPAHCAMLRAKRKALGLTVDGMVAHLARHGIICSRPTWRAWEIGVLPRADAWLMVACVLGLDPLLVCSEAWRGRYRVVSA